MATKIPEGFVAPISIGNFRDAAGNAAVIDTITSVTVSDPSKVEIIDIGGVQHVGPIVGAGAVADGYQVVFDVDVRVGPEVKSVLFIGTFDVPAGEAAAADVTIGGVVPRP